MKVEKLPSGSYRVRKTVDKRTYSFTFPHKPTKREIDDAIREKLSSRTDSSVRGTFEYYAGKYIESKSNVLSPSTIRGYHTILNGLSEEFRRIPLQRITSADVQIEINRLAGSTTRTGQMCTPKTVKNYNAFIVPVLSMFRPDLALHVTLPQSVESETYVPTDEEVRLLLDAVKGKSYELVIRLGVFALRESEACAVTDADLEGNLLHITKSKVQGPDGYVTKNYTKTESSRRTIWIDDYTAQLLRDQKVGFSGHPRKILEYLYAVQDKNGLHRCKYHALRHYYASMAHTQGIPDAYIMAAGGWKTDNVLKRVYRHAQKDKEEEMMQKVAEHMRNTIL